MDVKEKVAAIKTAVALPRGGNTSPELVRSAYTMLSFLAGFMLSAARLLGSGSPFGVAAVAAAGPGIYGAGCLIGAGLGYIVTGGLSWGIRYAAAVMLVFTAQFALQETKLGTMRLFAPTLAAVVTLVTGLLSFVGVGTLSSQTVGLTLLETVLAFACCSFFREALSDEERSTESAELRHLSAVLISFAVALMAPAGIVLFGEISVGRLAALLCVMTCALRCGALYGCTVGCVFGVAMDLALGGIPFFTMSYALSGLISGMLSKHGRLTFVLAFILANAASAVCVWQTEPQTSALFEVFCAAVIFAVLPSGFLSRVGAMFQETAAGSGESGLRRYVSRRVARLASAYSGVYEMVRRNVEEPFNDSDPSRIFDRAADSVCVGCKDKNRCWNREYMNTLAAMNDAGLAIRDKGRIELSDIPEHFSRRCLNPQAFVTAVNSELKAAAYRRQYAGNLRESRDTVWRQYGDMAALLDEVSKELGSINGADHLAERRLIRYLRTLDIEADAAVFRDGRGRLRAVIESGNLAPLLRQENYLDRLSEIVGLRLSKPKNVTEGCARLYLTEAEPLAVSVGIAAMKKKGEKVSGDRGTYFKTDAGVLCVILSDGMGSGDEAADESAEVIAILEEFLRAGINPAVAMKTLNSVMLLKSGDGWGFATVDLMCVDLFTGETCFYKYGAAPSYVMNGKSIKRIRGESFAPGLSGKSDAAPDVVRMRLKPGSTAIIASDGVISDANDAWLREILDSKSDDMKLLARDTLREAEKLYGKNDDMTVLAVRVEARA